MTSGDMYSEDLEAALRNAFNAFSAAYETIQGNDSHPNFVEPALTRDKLEKLLHGEKPEDEAKLYNEFDQILIRIDKDKQRVIRSDANSEAREFLQTAAAELIRAQRAITTPTETTEEASQNVDN